MFVANHVSTLMDKQMEILLNEALKSNAIEHTSWCASSFLFHQLIDTEKSQYISTTRSTSFDTVVIWQQRDGNKSN